MKSFFRAIVCLSWIGAAVAQTEQPQQPPVTPPAEPAPPRGIQAAPPPIPKVPDVRQPGETGYFIGVMGWFPTQQPSFNKGRGAAFTEESKNTFQGKPKYAKGAEIGIAMGLHNALRLSYFDMRATGDFTAGNDIHIFDQTYEKNTLVTSDYRLQHGKLSFDYLTWPFPVASRRFRLKTLWAVQYTAIRAGYDAPKKPLVDDNGFPLVDASGNPISYGAQGTRYILSPMFGLGAAYYSGRHFRVEANASGWTFPQRHSVWDADASANIRQGRLEFRFGVKGFHFKTTTNSDFYMKGTFYSGFAGIRWYSE